MTDFQDKTIIITGGGSGIGKATALLLGDYGANVVVAGRRENEGLKTVQEILDKNGKAIFVKTDVSDEAQVVELVEKTVKTFGDLYGAFNCAGIDGKKAPLVETTYEDWSEIIDINLKGTFLLNKYQIAKMLQQGTGGAIVNMTSVCSEIVRPGRCAYNSSRHGVLGLTRSAALEYARFGIRVNAIGPGSVKTAIYERSTQGNQDLQKAYADAHPIKRVAEPVEIARAAIWLMHPDSSFAIGHNLIVDGGFTLQ